MDILQRFNYNIIVLRKNKQINLRGKRKRCFFFFFLLYCRYRRIVSAAYELYKIIFSFVRENFERWHREWKKINKTTRDLSTFSSPEPGITKNDFRLRNDKKICGGRKPSLEVTRDSPAFLLYSCFLRVVVTQYTWSGYYFVFWFFKSFPDTISSTVVTVTTRLCSSNELRFYRHSRAHRLLFSRLLNDFCLSTRLAGDASE